MEKRRDPVPEMQALDNHLPLQRLHRPAIGFRLPNLSQIPISGNAQRCCISLHWRRRRSEDRFNRVEHAQS